MPPGFRRPLERGMDYKELKIETKDKVKLHGWFVKANRENPLAYRTILFFHGNAGNIGGRLPNIEVLVKKLKCNVLIVDYRGYGNSEGKPSEKGLALDAEATLFYALDKLRDLVNEQKLYVFGRSLGAAVAIRLAQEYSVDIKGLILENAFTSVTDMAGAMIPGLFMWLFKPFRVLV